MAGDRSYSDLIDHPVQEIDAFLEDFELEEEWVGIVGGPQRSNADVLLVYDVRLVDGPYEGMVGRTWEYWLTEDEAVDAPEIYREQVEAIRIRFPEATVQCYEPLSWSDSARE